MGNRKCKVASMFARSAHVSVPCEGLEGGKVLGELTRVTTQSRSCESPFLENITMNHFQASHAYITRGSSAWAKGNMRTQGEMASSHPPSLHAELLELLPACVSSTERSPSPGRNFLKEGWEIGQGKD